MPSADHFPKRTGLLLSAVLILAACSDSGNHTAQQQPPLPAPAAAAESSWRVVGTFGVGDGVYVRSFAVEPNADHLWIGTSVGVLGIDLKTEEVKETFTRKEGLANEYVFAIMSDSQGNKWFGTNGGGASRYRDGQWRTFFPMHGLADYWVYAFGEQSTGDIWIGTWYGANRFEPVSGKFTTYVDELVNEWVYGIDVDSRDRVWFGTEGGISMYDGKEWHAWTHADGLGAPNSDNRPISTNTGLGTRARHDPTVFTSGGPTYNPNYVFTVHVRDDDTVWAGTWGGGVSYFDGSRWKNYTTADGLAGNIVFSITEAEDGALWFGTDAGLSRFDGKKWSKLTRQDGLLGNNIYAVAAAPGNKIWVGSRGGVTVVGR